MKATPKEQELFDKAIERLTDEVIKEAGSDADQRKIIRLALITGITLGAQSTSQRLLDTLENKDAPGTRGTKPRETGGDSPG